MTTTANAPTANDHYKHWKERVEDHLLTMAGRLEKHAERQAKDKKNWGYPGDLANIAATLEDILETFAVD